MYWGRDKASMFLDSKGYETSIMARWNNNLERKEKDIGGEDAFNQEYGLRFVNSGRSLLSEYNWWVTKIRKTIYTQNF
jgi:hypothetical protein